MNHWFAARLRSWQRLPNSPRQWMIPAALITLPLLFLAVLVLVLAVNVPMLDQWELVPLWQKYHQGGLSFADFFAQHNEHRLLFPRLLMFGLAVLSKWNVVWEMLASLVIAGVAFVLLYKVLAKTFTNLWLRWVAAATLSIIFFSTIQWENWLWGWQVQWY